MTPVIKHWKQHELAFSSKDTKGKKQWIMHPKTLQTKFKFFKIFNISNIITFLTLLVINFLT